MESMHKKCGICGREKVYNGEQYRCRVCWDQRSNRDEKKTEWDGFRGDHLTESDLIDEGFKMLELYG